MKEIKLLRKQKGEEYTVKVDDCDADLFEMYKYHIQVNRSGHVYVRRWVRPDNGRKSYPHVNLQWDVYARRNGKISKNILIDHKNGDTLDNTFGNLRIATRGQNRHNSKGISTASSKYKGVHKFKNGTYSVVIKHNDIRIVSHGYKDETEAAKIADKIYYGLYGEFARLNFPNELKKAI
ncbi:MAG TPA: HNH endonuclease [Bacteroidia bacterium]|nr:HNH endonuclease [Bacteroidia bacterium]